MKITEFTATIRVRGEVEEEFTVPLVKGQDLRVKEFELHWEPSRDGWQTRRVQCRGVWVKNGQLTREQGKLYFWMAETKVPQEVLDIVERCRPTQPPPRPADNSAYVPLGSRKTP